MTEHRGYQNGARSRLSQFRPAAGCNTMTAARPLPVASVTIEIEQVPRMVAPQRRCAPADLTSEAEGPVFHV